MIYLQLYLSFLQVGLFSVGGGYAAMPLIRSQVVELHPWMTLQEFTNLITIAEMTPGPIAVNCATFVGLRIAQLPGAVIATLGCITPALVLKGMQAGVAAVILDVVCSMGGKVIASHSAVSLFLMVAAFAANYIFGVNVVLIILAAALFGVVRAALARKRTV